MVVAGQHGHPRPPARGGRKKRGASVEPENQGLGRSRGGFSTKLHATVNGLGLPVGLQLPPGQQADVTQPESLVEGYQPEAVLGDKGYDSEALVPARAASGTPPACPP